MEVEAVALAEEGKRSRDGQNRAIAVNAGAGLDALKLADGFVRVIGAEDSIAVRAAA